MYQKGVTGSETQAIFVFLASRGAPGPARCKISRKPVFLDKNKCTKKGSLGVKLKRFLCFWRPGEPNAPKRNEFVSFLKPGNGGDPPATHPANDNNKTRQDKTTTIETAPDPRCSRAGAAKPLRRVPPSLRSAS